MHDIAYVEAEDPIVCTKILDAERASGRDLVPLLHLQLVHLLEGLERDFQLLLLSHAVLEVISPFFIVKVCYCVELELNIDKLFNDSMRLFDLLLEYLYLIRQIV